MPIACRSGLALLICIALIVGAACTGDVAGSSTSNSDGENDVAIEDTAAEDISAEDISNQDDLSSQEDTGLADADIVDDVEDNFPGLEFTIGPDDRPARVLLPDDYDASQPLPVIFLFHGYTATSEVQDTYFDLSPRRQERQFIIVLPEGLEDSTGQQYWNATDFCCDHYGDEPDDVGYFLELLDELLDRVAADADRIHLMGHSNGHFFANRLACDHGSRIATVVGLGGGGHWDGDDCPEDGRISMLHIHGTADAVIYYTGAIGLYRSARTMTDRWAERNACSGDSSIYDNISVSSVIFGDETTRRSYDDCPDNISVELWSVVGGSHMPVLEEDVTDRILDFILSKTNPDAQ